LNASFNPRIGSRGAVSTAAKIEELMNAPVVGVTTAKRLRFAVKIPQ
jgi:hypothetical protein